MHVPGFAVCSGGPFPFWPTAPVYTLTASGDDLRTSQLNKLDALIDKAALGPKDHLLEVGCGWGSLAMRAAQRTGCR